MTDHSFVPLPGSERRALPQAQPAGTIDESERIEVTLVTRRRAELRRDASGAPVRLSRAELQQRHGTDPADVERVTRTLSPFGLEVTGSEPGARRITVAGPASAMSAAFGAELSMVTSRAPGAPGAPGRQVTHRYREGGLRIPAELDGIVLAVLGLDTRPQARSQARMADSAAATTSYTPPQVADVYQFPLGTDGTGQSVGIIELGGGFSTTDLTSYFTSLNVPVPSVTAQGIDGASNVADQDPNGADGEVLLDIEVAGSVAPGAAQVVYFAPNTDQGFVDAVTAAVHATPTPAAVSISWGQSEDSWTAQARTALDAAIADGVALGVTVCVAAGDNGSGDGVTDGKPHVDFPASSPHALACGGTSLQANPATGVITSETTWNDGSSGGAGGGGVSDTFGQPAWQADAGVPANGSGATGRGVPDVAGNADPATGYQVLVDGQQAVVGGTSAVAPLWAALICRLAQATGSTFGLVQETLYAGIQPGQDVPGFQDITTGNNGAYSAGPGWDACTGLGSPNGTALLSLVSGGTAVTGVTGTGYEPDEPSVAGAP
ncbi:MAG TPA: S53 family peptidase [Streptosporangiaceae bacterium]|nr:S53 family peptidase [Streptosporangiaceae bacterium]